LDKPKTPSRSVVSTSTQTDILQALGLLASLPSRSSEFSNQAYFVALDGVTRKHLFRATERILKGALGHAFFPSPPEFRLLCDKQVEADLEDARKQRMLEEERAMRAEARFYDEQRTPEAKERVKAIYDEYRAKDDARRAAEAVNGPDQEFWDRVNPKQGKVFPGYTTAQVNEALAGLDVSREPQSEQ
jgi:hypothetical protein